MNITTNNQTAKAIINYYPNIDVYILEYKRLLVSFYKKKWVSISELSIIMRVGRNEASNIIKTIYFDKSINLTSQPLRRQGNKYSLEDLVIGLGLRMFLSTAISVWKEETYLKKIKFIHHNRKELIQKMRQEEKEIKQLIKTYKRLNIKNEFADFTESKYRRLKIKDYIYTKPYISIQEFAFILDIDERKASILLQDALNGGDTNPNHLPLRKIYSKYNLYDLSEIFSFSIDIYRTDTDYNIYLSNMYEDKNENVKSE